VTPHYKQKRLPENPLRGQPAAGREEISSNSLASGAADISTIAGAGRISGSAADHCPADTRVEVIGVEDTTLKVEPGTN